MKERGVRNKCIVEVLEKVGRYGDSDSDDFSR